MSARPVSSSATSRHTLRIEGSCDRPTGCLRAEQCERGGGTDDKHCRGRTTEPTRTHAVGGS